MHTNTLTYTCHLRSLRFCYYVQSPAYCLQDRYAKLSLATCLCFQHQPLHAMCLPEDASGIVLVLCYFTLHRLFICRILIIQRGWKLKLSGNARKKQKLVRLENNKKPARDRTVPVRVPNWQKVADVHLVLPPLVHPLIPLPNELLYQITSSIYPKLQICKKKRGKFQKAKTNGCWPVLSITLPIKALFAQQWAAELASR